MLKLQPDIFYETHFFHATDCYTCYVFMRVKDINMPHVQVTHLNRFETYLSQIPILFLKFVAFTDSIVYMNMKAQNSFLGTI